MCREISLIPRTWDEPCYGMHLTIQSKISKALGIVPGRFMGPERYNLEDKMNGMYLKVGLSWQSSSLRGIVRCAHLEEVMGGRLRHTCSQDQRQA